VSALLRLAGQAVAQLWFEYRRDRAAARAAKAWAEKPSPGPRACWNCGGLVYAPAGSLCGRCGAPQH